MESSMETFSASLQGQLLQVVPRRDDGVLSRIVLELKREYGTIPQEPLPPSWLVLLDRLGSDGTASWRLGP